MAEHGKFKFRPARLLAAGTQSSWQPLPITNYPLPITNSLVRSLQQFRSEARHVSEIDPADSAAGGNAEIPEEFDEELEGAGGTAARLKKPVREGLPAGYRMRADAHYVDQLSSRRVERPVDARER